MLTKSKRLPNRARYDIAESTVARPIDRSGKLPSPTWRNFLKSHATQIAAMDFFTVPTVAFKILFCVVLLRHGDRKFLHINVTTNLTAAWAAQQIVKAFPYEETPRYILRDRDSIKSLS